MNQDLLLKDVQTQVEIGESYLPSGVMIVDLKFEKEASEQEPVSVKIDVYAALALYRKLKTLLLE